MIPGTCFPQSSTLPVIEARMCSYEWCLNDQLDDLGNHVKSPSQTHSNRRALPSSSASVEHEEEETDRRQAQFSAVCQMKAELFVISPQPSSSLSPTTS